MAVVGDGNFHIYVVNVGQGDTSVVISPGGSVTVIDAYRPDKLVDLLRNKLNNDGNIEQLVISHPHSDHYSGANRLAVDFNIGRALLCPYWHSGGMGPPSYRALVNRLDVSGTQITFLSGYSRWFPDAFFVPNPGNGDSDLDNDAPYYEFLG